MALLYDFEIVAGDGWRGPRGTAATDFMAVGGDTLGGLLGGDALGNDELIGGGKNKEIDLNRFLLEKTNAIGKILQLGRLAHTGLTPRHRAACRSNRRRPRAATQATSRGS